MQWQGSSRRVGTETGQGQWGWGDGIQEHPRDLGVAWLVGVESGEEVGAQEQAGTLLYQPCGVTARRVENYCWWSGRCPWTTSLFAAGDGEARYGGKEENL